MAQEAISKTEPVDTERRNLLYHPDIDGIEDLDGEVERYEIGIENLQDLSRGDVVQYTGDGDPEGWFVVTGRHESSGETTDETDVIELKAGNRHADTLLSRPASIADLHARAAFGKIKAWTGLKAVMTRLIERVTQQRDAIRLRRDGDVKR